MIYDIFTYNGERDILKLHLSILQNYVDKFIICEAKKTFSGADKPLYFFRDQRYFQPFWRKLEHFVISDTYSPEEFLVAKDSPNIHGASHWLREFLQKEQLTKAMEQAHIMDEDTVFIGDVDEIINPEANFYSDTPVKAKLKVYAYHLNNLSNEDFHGTLIAQYGDIKGKCLNHLRSDKKLYTDKELGWHFTSMGGEQEVRRKLNDSYTAESYNTEEVQTNLHERLENHTDYLGRNFTFSLDESEWPQYLKDNKKTFKHLCL